jgi:hypothetical protein
VLWDSSIQNDLHIGCCRDVAVHRFNVGSFVSQALRARIKNNFTYHSPSPVAIKEMTELREKILELALLIEEITPEGSEQSAALLRLEEVMFHANASIARRYPIIPKEF